MTAVDYERFGFKAVSDVFAIAIAFQLERILGSHILEFEWLF